MVLCHDLGQATTLRDSVEDRGDLAGSMSVSIKAGVSVRMRRYIGSVCVRWCSGGVCVSACMRRKCCERTSQVLSESRSGFPWARCCYMLCHRVPAVGWLLLLSRSMSVKAGRGAIPCMIVCERRLVCDSVAAVAR